MSFTPRSKPKSVETLLNSFWKYCAQDNGSKLFWILKPFSTLQSYSIWSWSQSLRKSSLLCLKCLSFQLHCKNLQAQWSTPKVRLEFLQEPQFWALLQVSFSRKSRLQRSTKKEWWSSLDMRKSSETSLSITQTYSTNFTTSLHKFTKFFWRKTPKSSFWTGTMHWFKETWKKRNLALVSKGQATQNFLMTVWSWTLIWYCWTCANHFSVARGRSTRTLIPSITCSRAGLWCASTRQSTKTKNWRKWSFRKTLEQ